MAPPPNYGTPAPPLGASLFPALLLGIVSAIAALWLARRKGRSQWWALLAFVPGLGFLVFLYLLSLTDKRVLDDIEALKKRTGNDPKF